MPDRQPLHSTLLRAKPSKDGDAESRGYRGSSAMLAGPPAFRLHVEIGGPFFCARKEVPMTFKYKLSVRLALLKDRPLPVVAAEGKAV